MIQVGEGDEEMAVEAFMMIMSQIQIVWTMTV
jgi:hypothetical protein